MIDEIACLCEVSCGFPHAGKQGELTLIDWQRFRFRTTCVVNEPADFQIFANVTEQMEVEKFWEILSTKYSNKFSTLYILRVRLALLYTFLHIY